MGVLMLAALLVSSVSCSRQAQPLTLDQRAQKIYNELMCPLCAGETIAQSSTEISAQMRALVREKLQQGATEQQILQYFKQRYGESVLASPQKSGFTLIVWIAPFLVIIAGAAILWIIIRRRVRGGRTAVPEAPLTPEEIEYSKRLEKDLEEFDEKGFR